MVLHRDCGACFAGLNRGDDILWLNATVPLRKRTINYGRRGIGVLTISPVNHGQ